MSSPVDRRAKFRALDGAALVVSTIVGAGIFTVPAYVAGLAGAPAVILSLWVVGGLMALAGALSYAELAARLPKGGAEYVYLREAFGPLAGFLSGWTSFIAGFSGAIAAAAVGFAGYLIAAVPASAAFGVDAIALTVIVLFTTVSLAGVRASRVATTALAVLIVVGIAALALASVGSDAVVVPSSAAPGVGTAALSALVPIFFTYSGWNAAAYVAGEFEDPARNVPRALIGGTLIVTVLYVGLNAGLVATLSPVGLAPSSAPVAAAAAVVWPNVGSAWVTALALAALASSVCAMVVTGPRIYLEMARDGAMPSWFAKVRRRDGVPFAAVIAQSAWSCVLAVTGTFEQIVTYTGFSIVLFSGAAVCALFVLRRRFGKPAGYAVPGYPLVPLAFVLCSAAITIASVRYAPGPSLVGVALIASGGALHVVIRRRGARAKAGAALNVAARPPRAV
jgi:APA family basic amino acid/polyamine antiporter